jgi:hypothetical protein
MTLRLALLSSHRQLDRGGPNVQPLPREKCTPPPRERLCNRPPHVYRSAACKFGLMDFASSPGLFRVPCCSGFLLLFRAPATTCALPPVAATPSAVLVPASNLPQCGTGIEHAAARIENLCVWRSWAGSSKTSNRVDAKTTLQESPVRLTSRLGAFVLFIAGGRDSEGLGGFASFRHPGCEVGVGCVDRWMEVRRSKG